MLIAIAVFNPRLYYNLTKSCREYNVDFVSIKPGDPIPPIIKAVIVGVESKDFVDHRQKIVAKPGFEESAVLQAISRTLKSKRMIIGIDPGLKTGIAVLVDRKSILSISSTNKYDLSEKIYKIVKWINPEKIDVKIGSGDLENGKELVNILLGKLSSYKVDVFIVNEYRTSKNSKGKDEKAALKIAYAIPTRRYDKNKRSPS